MKRCTLEEHNSSVDIANLDNKFAGELFLPQLWQHWQRTSQCIAYYEFYSNNKIGRYDGGTVC